MRFSDNFRVNIQFNSLKFAEQLSEVKFRNDTTQLSNTMGHLPINIYLFKVNNRNTRKRCVYQEVRNNSFSENFTYVLNE